MLDNPKKDLLPALVMRVIEFREAAGSAVEGKPLLEKDALDKASIAIKRAKVTIGVEYALSKLIKIATEKNPVVQQDTATKALAKVSDKGIALPKFLKEALSRFKTPNQ